MANHQRLLLTVLLCTPASCAPAAPASSAPVATASAATPVDCAAAAPGSPDCSATNPDPIATPDGAACPSGSAWRVGGCSPQPCPGFGERDALGDCRRARTKAEQEALSSAIKTTEDAYHTSRFKDLELAVELARLQLLRGAKAASDGDAEEAQRNAQRAAATDASRPLSRVIIALTQSHRMLESIARAQPAMRGARLDVLQQLVEASLPAAEGAEAAVLHSLVGFIQLDRGDADGAKASFLTALTLFPKFAAAELGAGDAARASGDFAGAQAAYERCLHLDPSNPDAELGLDAVAKRTKLQLNRLPPPPSGMPTLDQAPLANVGASANPCSAAERKATPTLCKAVAELRKPRDDEGLKQASRLVLDEVLAQDCMKQRTQCGEQIPRAVLEAARAFARGKDWPKVIVAARVALSNPSFSKVQQDALLLTADAFYTIGVTSMAASFYGKYAAGAPQDEKAALRGFLLQLVELDADAVRTQAVALGRNLRIPQETRAAVMQLSEMLQPEAHESGRATALGISRGIRAIIADPSWSPAHGR